MITGIVIAIAVVVIVVILYVLSRGIYIVKQAEGIVIERLGRFERILDSGWNWVVPFIDNPRPFTWRKTYIDSYGRMKATDTVQIRIDLRETVFNFPAQEVYTRDTVLLDVNSIMYYRIVDIKKAVYEIDDLNMAISNVAQTQLKEVFGSMTFTKALASQHAINEHMKQSFGERFSSWGVKVERMEILDMTPKQGTTIGDAMKRQMIAERERRAEFIIAEARKAAMRLVSEGTKLQKYNLGVAEQEATRKISEGLAAGKVEVARAESKALDLIADAFDTDGSSQTQYMIAQRYIRMLEVMMDKVDSKFIYLPYQTNGLHGLIGSLKTVYGPSAPKYSGSPKKLPSKESKYSDLN